MTDAERQHLEDTLQHIRTVQFFLHRFIEEIQDRIRCHDKSKLQEPEFSGFAETVSELRDTTYGSEEYERLLERLDPVLEHHYANNPHHPEHHENGIDDMTLVDLVEMLADWRAATERHDDGDIQASLRINAERFDISPQLAQILQNTVDRLHW